VVPESSIEKDKCALVQMLVNQNFTLNIIHLVLSSLFLFFYFSSVMLTDFAPLVCWGPSASGCMMYNSYVMLLVGQ